MPWYLTLSQGAPGQGFLTDYIYSTGLTDQGLGNQFSFVSCYCQEYRSVTVKLFLRTDNSYPCSADTENYQHTVNLKLCRV